MIRDLTEHVPSFAIIFHHPDYGAFRVGQIGERTGSPNGTDAWSWQIGWGTLNGRLHVMGTAATKKEASGLWKAAWPTFKAARSAEQWYEAKRSEDSDTRKWAVFDARKLTSDKAELERLNEELRRTGIGPPSQFVLDILARGRE